MSNNSRIEWTEATWNPVIGCTKISAGCKHCYAEVMARRLKAIGVPGYEYGFKRIRLRPEKLSEPIARLKPTTYFVNSMSDLFHPGVPDEFIDQAFATMRMANWHTYQVLTKRPERMAEYLRLKQLPEHIWLGTSVENRRHGVPRIEHLRRINVPIRFLSVEPLLEDIGDIDLKGIAWVIVGGESGIGARRMDIAWVRSIHQQCDAVGATFFFKQWGAHGPDGIRRSKKANGRMLDGRHWNEMPV
jgi:protein gp37